MKFLLLFCALATLATSCTTLSNRRDLYNPSEDAGPYNTLPPAHPIRPEAENPPALREPLPPSPR
ncbi:MAG: hypothetical protein H0X34_15570 [Chthoniobacterales bacterium]|nr:hypothetical protein [Chthoniobacterales bacterium]